MSKDAGEQTLESMNQAKWYNDWLLKKVSPYLKGDILEIGCGIGNFTKQLLAYGKVTATDIDKSYITKTQNLVYKKAEVGFADIEKGEYFFGKKKFDSIVCINVLGDHG